MLLRVLRTYLPRYPWKLAVLILLQSGQALFMLLLPGITADIVDVGIMKDDTGYIWSRGGLMLAVSVGQIVFASLAIYIAARISMELGRDVRGDLFHRVSSYSRREVGQFGAPSLINRNTNDVYQVQMFVVMLCSIAIIAPVMGVGGIIMALRQDRGLAWILVVAVPALAVAVFSVVGKMIPKFRLMQTKIDRVNEVLREQLTGIRVVRAFVREDAERRRFGRANDELTATWISAGHWQALLFPIVMVAMNASSVAVLWFGAGRIESGSMGVGALIAFLTYTIQILMSVIMAMFLAIMAPRAAVCADRIQEVLDTSSTIGSPDQPVRLDDPLTTVELRGVGFNYPGAQVPVLDDIDLVLRPGTTTAVIGSTGSGKTTLVNLIPRLMEATSGAVLVNDVDVRDLDPEELWSRIGLVPQKAFLFAGTVASNLRFAKPDATDDELWEALRVAQAADFVAARPDGLDSRIDQGGQGVSGGQRQRLAIARALVRRPGIYLFDDTFSALDVATEARLRAALEPYTADSAVLVVAQRISSIRSADQILVLEDGRAVGLGTHDELTRTCATYQEIVDSQLAAEETR